jgi:hypothetical protein
MKIPRQFQQFKDEPTLLLVAGRQTAVLYEAKDGILNKIDSFEIPKPRYSDREGEFRRRGRGVTVSSGVPKELRDDDIINDFLKELKKRLKPLSKPEKLIVFAPDKTRHKILDVLPKAWQQKVTKVIRGNYFNKEPLDVISRISPTK